MEQRVLGRILLTAAFLAGAVAVASGSLGSWLADYDGWVCRQGDYHVAEGEALLHGIGDPVVSFSMPGFSIPHALLCDHASASLQMLVRSLSLLTCGALVFWLGLMLHSEVCGGAAALLFALVIPPTLTSDRWLYTVHVLLVACALVWRAKAPDVRRSLLLGLAIGMSLLVLSPLCLFPLVLAAYEWRRASAPGAQGPAERRRQMLAILLVPYLCLAPWLLMNWRFHHRLIIFEDGRATANIIAGALGFVSTGLDKWKVMSQDLPVRRDVLLWAVQQVLHHPLRFLAGFGQRAFYAASAHPAIFVSSLAAVWIFRKREEHRQLSLLAGYFFGMHCLLSVEHRYFEPLLPLLAVLAALGALSWLKPTMRGPGRLGAGLVTAVLAPLALLQSYAVGLVVSYPSRAAAAAPFERELARDPQDPWLRAERGSRLLAQGRPGPAAADLGAAIALAPQRPEWRMRFAWARMAQGGPGAGFWDRLHLEALTHGPSLARWQAFRTIYFLRQGKVAEARGALGLREDMSRPPASALESDIVLVRQRPPGTAKPDAHDFDGALSCWPAPARPRLSAQLARLLAEEPLDDPGLADLWLREAWSAIRLGQRAAALAAMDLSQRYQLDPKLVCRAAGFYCAMGERIHAHQVIRDMFRLSRRDFSAEQYHQGLQVLASWVARHPRDVGLLFRWAEEARTAGLSASAVEALDRACAMRLDVEHVRRAAGLYSALNRPRRAREILARLPAPQEERRLRDARLLLAMAEKAVRTGPRDWALRCVAEALKQRLDPQDLGRGALIYQGLAEYRRELGVLDKLIHAEPRQARWRSDRGVAEALLGMRAAAAADWEHAISLEPGFLPAYLSLGSLYASSGRPTEATRLYDDALRQPFSDNPAQQDIRERIRGESMRLLGPGR